MKWPAKAGTLGTMRTTRSKRALLFAARGQLETKGASRPCEVRVLAPVRRDTHEYSARVKLTAPYRIDQEITGGTAKQARDLAFGLVHRLFDGAVLRDDEGGVVSVPGEELRADDDKDDGVRAPDGVVACVVERDARTVRLILDVAHADGEASQWSAKSVHTWFDLDRERFRYFKLTDDELEAIGAAVVSRLAAMSKLPRRRAR
jgi:hypothetical protein